MELPSKHLQAAVEALGSLPGIGQRTALRLALHLLRQPEGDIEKFSNSFSDLKKHVHHCASCNNISDDEICSICTDQKRDQSLICVVEDVSDVIAIESTRQYKGLYHVLGGVISPMDGIGPQDLSISLLLERAEKDGVKELLFALSTTMEGDTTAFYLFKKLKDAAINISTLARGIGVGDELQYADELTLGRSILNRTSYEGSISKS
jgi:recombination protein RecR